MIVEVLDSERPPCPNKESSAHLVHTRILTEAASYLIKDDNKVPVSYPAEQMYGSISEGSFDGCMYLYKISVIARGKRIIVESYYFKCAICNLILPAQVKPWMTSV